MLRHDHVPVWLNGSRLRFLRRFREELARYFDSVTYEAFPFRVVETDDARGLRESLEPRLRRCRRMVGATGRVSLLRLAPGERAGDVERVNLIDAAFHLNRYNLGKGDVLEALDQAVRAYEEDRSASWLRTFNPLFWLDLTLNYVEQVPFLPLRLFGVKPSRAASTSAGHLIRVLVRLVALLGLALLVVRLSGWHDGAAARLRDLLARLPW